MRCVDVIETLGARPGPASAPLSAELAEHLAHCPQCAAWAQRDEQLARLWDATRPTEPSAGAWTAVWADVTQALETTPAPLPAPVAATPSWQRWAFGAFATAQAAALLLAAWLGSMPAPAAASPKVDIPYGQVVLLSLSDGAAVKVVSRGPEEGSTAVDGYFVMLDFFEAKAE